MSRSIPQREMSEAFFFFFANHTHSNDLLLCCWDFKKETIVGVLPRSLYRSFYFLVSLMNEEEEASNSILCIVAYFPLWLFPLQGHFAFRTLALGVYHLPVPHQ
mmetsp:Transcript_10588/g.21608  ORF Transcript_10588/g.21608 Transcript_10588/m.21608 type:complete len:104 (-) Transcript_10588:1004-1315(-)